MVSNESFASSSDEARIDTIACWHQSGEQELTAQVQACH